MTFTDKLPSKTSKLSVYDVVAKQWRIFDIAYAEFEGHTKEQREAINQYVIPIGAMHDAIKLTKNRMIVELEAMEEKANFFYTDSKDLTAKNYERGRYDALHNAIAHFKEQL